MSLPRDVARRALPEAFGADPAPAEHASDFADGAHLRRLLEEAEFDVRTFEKYAAGLWAGSIRLVS
jgi:hypothetical protein